VSAFLIVLCAVVGLFVGGWVGLWLGDREGGDFNFAPVLYAPFGAMVGCLAGTVVGAAVFT
jgi:hypothetical protein